MVGRRLQRDDHLRGNQPGVNSSQIHRHNNTMQMDASHLMSQRPKTKDPSPLKVRT